MSVMIPESFAANFAGPEGSYTLTYRRSDVGDDVIEAMIDGSSMTWHVEIVETQENGGMSLSGLTRGSEKIWNDCFWFELIMLDRPLQINYWNNGLIWRTDAVVRI